MLRGWAVALRLPEMGSAGKLAERLRLCAHPVITGAGEDRVLFHMRTVRPGDEKWILEALADILPPAPERKI